MHANLQQLLSIRDGAPVDAVWREHVAECRHCQRELEQLECVTRGLRALAAEDEAPESVWREVRARLRRDERPTPVASAWARLKASSTAPLGARQALLEGAVASAFAVLLVVVLRAWSVQLQLAEQSIGAGFAGDSAHATTSPVNFSAPDDVLSRNALQEHTSSTLRTALGAGATASTHVRELEDAIATIDQYCLTEKNLPPAVEGALALQRSMLMDELSEAYGTPTTEAGTPQKRP